MKQVERRKERIRAFLEWIKEHPEIPPYMIPITYSAVSGLALRTVREYYEILRVSGLLPENKAKMGERRILIS
ncbi:hypothetical protein J7L60_06055 [Candidatus Bathyarchaeota archaeon]|nr:hypothetical protein [Candidatus Bathyarchaeota archaeon]